MMGRVGLTRSIQAAVAAALVLGGAVLAGCGEAEPKRSVDARAEVLQFYAADAPVVAVLRPQPVAGVVELDRAAESLPVWRTLRRTVRGWLGAAGLGAGELRRLVRPKEPIEEFDASALALGAATPADLAYRRALLVLVTDQSELLERLLGREAAAGRLRRVEQVDEAVLYRGHVASYAIRDGVLVSARHIADVRTAIERRDGDSDLQLDEDVVQGVFDELEPQGPLLVYASLDGVREADLGLRALGRGAPWTGTLNRTAATARVVDGELRIAEVSVTDGEQLESADLPIGAEPSPFEIDASAAATLIPIEGPVRGLLAGLGPVEGEATAGAEEVRLQVRQAP